MRISHSTFEAMGVIVKNLGKPSTTVELDPSIRVREHDEVYRPAEDSYLLLRSIELRSESTFLEVGTGTGLIALHAASHARTVATDVSPLAVGLCRANAQLNGIQLEVVRTDLFAGLEGRFEVIAFNPPYLPVEERGDWLDAAWSGGPDGSQVISRFLREAGDYLGGKGRIYLLLSTHNAAALELARTLYDVRPLLRKPMFFEEIAVYELRHRHHNPRAHNL
ncbi:MAG: HemK2/MTQ2 family protein methyltransferase [Thermoplasmata archaeon]